MYLKSKALYTDHKQVEENRKQCCFITQALVFSDKLKDERTIEVLNAGCKDSATGEMKSASGIAVFDPEKPGQLSVGFKTPPKDNSKPNCNSSLIIYYIFF